MAGILLIVTLIIIAAVYFIYFMKESLVCHQCKSKDVTRTGGSRYKETSNVLFFGSPDSYKQAEYKCTKCGHIFWEEKSIPGTS